MRVPPRATLIAAPLVAVAAAAALSACDPYPSAATGTANVVIEVSTNGVAHVRVHFPDDYDRPDRRQVGEAVARAVFPAADTFRSRTDDNYGSPLAIIDVGSVYRPGPHVVLTVDATGAASILAAVGMATINLTVCAPFVPLTMTASPAQHTSVGRCVGWAGVAATAARVTIDMRPSPVRWWLQIGIVALALAGNAAALTLLAGRSLTTRRRIAAASSSAGALVLCGIGIATASAVQSDNLGVLGELSGAPLTLAGLLGLLVLPLAVPSLAITLVALLVRGRRPAPA